MVQMASKNEQDEALDRVGGRRLCNDQATDSQVQARGRSNISVARTAVVEKPL